MLPVITIAREFGSGGHEVGTKLAEQLGIKYYDKELIAMAARKSGLSEEIFAQADEKAGNSLLYSMVMGNYPFGSRFSGVGEMPINDQLFVLQTDLIKKAATEGPCVVIGRCGDYILREFPHVFKIFIHAKKEQRMECVVRAGLTEPKKASEFVAKKDKQRANYYNFYSNRRWDDLSNYDLTIDCSTFTID
ncbi:MAG: cytidylate kinase-like family protein, partial [Oscillospiraceae bacterium]